MKIISGNDAETVRGNVESLPRNILLIGTTCEKAHYRL